MNIIDVIFGSTSDEEKVLPGLVQATRDIPDLAIVVHYASADNTPKKLRTLIEDMTEGMNPEEPAHVYISGAGLSNVLTGVIKTMTRINDLVIGIPISDESSEGLTSLLSTVEKPPRNPVLAVGVDNSYAAVQIAYRFMQGINNIVIPTINGIPSEINQTEKLRKEFDRVGLSYVTMHPDGISSDVLVVRPFFDRGELSHIDRKLAEGSGIQLAVLGLPISGYGPYQHVLDNTSVTGMVGSQSYGNAVQMAAILTRNKEVLDRIVTARTNKAKELSERKGWLIQKGEAKKN